MKSLNHTVFLVFNLLLFSLLTVSGESNLKKPNLIIILADDLGYADLGMHGSKQIPTPHIDKLGKEGIVFSSGYVSSAVCSPSRAGLLTGKNQLGFGYNNNLGPN
jgi:arylsulfatase A-like enzyme